MSDIPTIVLAVDDAATMFRLRQIVRAGYKILEEVHDGAGILECVQMRRPMLVLVDQDLPSMGGFEVAQRLSERMPEVTTVVIARSRDVDTVRDAMEAGARDVLFRPLEDEEVLKTLSKALEHQLKRLEAQEKEHRPSGSGIWSFASAGGGVGRTTLILSVAAELQAAGRRTVVVDLDLLFGDVAFYLGLVGRNPNLSGLLDDGNYLEQAVLYSYLRVHAETGVHILVPPPEIEDAYGVDYNRLFNVINALRQYFDVVLLDMPAGLPSDQLKLLDHSRFVFLVANGSLGALKNLRSLVLFLRRLEIPARRLYPLLTAFEENERELEEFNKLLAKIDREESVRFTFPRDVAAAKRAVNTARPLIRVEPRSAYAKSVQSFTDEILRSTGDDFASEPPGSSRRSVLSRFLGG